MMAKLPRHLVVAHYHLRPGGVRRVIETALPAMAGNIDLSSVTLATGEEPDEAWLGRVRASLGGLTLHVEVRREFLYWSEIAPSSGLEAPLVRSCTELLAHYGGGDAVLWAHNLALGRNAPLAAAWTRAVAATGAVFVSHHHDFFFDNRWGRWSEMEKSGLDDLASAARVVFPAGPRTVHLAINRADHELLSAEFGERTLWVPDPVVSPVRHAGRDDAARAWLASRTGRASPYWLLPCRLLRRKNIAEALLLARWLRPDVRVVTTGAPTSADEMPYNARLLEGARRGGWPLDLSVLAGATDAPPVSALIGGADAVLLTSLQEGFGLPYVEAAVAERPLVARSLPNVLPDLVSLGLRVPVTYDEIRVPCDLFDAHREREHQRRLWEAWKRTLPGEVRSLAGEPFFAAGTHDLVPFSRLTMTAHLEILGRSPDDLAAALAPANPELAAWCGSGLPSAGFDGQAASALSPGRFADHFREAVVRALAAEGAPDDVPERVLHRFLVDRLRSGNLYPMVFAPET